MKKRRVLLLGGSGYLGAQIYDCLRQDGENEVLATCFSAGQANHLIRLDVTDEPSFVQLLQEFSPDVVIWALMSSMDEQVMIKSGISTLLAHLREESKVIYISSDGIFGQGTGAFAEEDEVVPLDERNPLAPYSRAKQMGEELVQKRHGNHVIARIGPIYGCNSAGKWDKRVASMQTELVAGREITRSGNLYKTFVHVEDLGLSICELAAGAFTGTLHLGPSAKESYYSFFRKLAAALGLNVNLIKENRLSEEEARERGVPLDTSLDTRMASRLLHTRFRQA
ncbi:NAD(P)-dependent oxidoreductase [Brevibacillus reuszeri]|uniref:NAD(P)-dependent oxidoreductase n=1 Tax=Brevibacillus reuszeri TaxID=54915 RepID=A0A0K9YKS2_9BACL|nr:NAD-dependent epimerase/dehydratase family protein [Brevibacillus reuszeri]KNB68795.1 dTDP-4-dehydrorhamnose reductase [Brevibacillus reuszeri]MED1859102.1 sugar nucleotide-binding protein [Brevibacillus reuszeri]GED69320.1 NAD(P)-dependent oxidoreductase [Brevibacillus reuszeri]